jgi:hypothetical protein
MTEPAAAAAAAAVAAAEPVEAATAVGLEAAEATLAWAAAAAVPATLALMAGLEAMQAPPGAGLRPSLLLEMALGQGRAVTGVARQPVHKAPGAEVAAGFTDSMT